MKKDEILRKSNRFFILLLLFAVNIELYAIDLPSQDLNGCTKSGTVYQCAGNLSFQNNVTFNLSSDVTISVGGDFRANNNFEAISLNGSRLTLNVGGSVNINNNINFQGDIVAGGNVFLGNNGDVYGDLTAGGSLNIGSTVVYGNCTPINDQCRGVFPIAEYRLDECGWDGTNGEVENSSSSNHYGTVINGALNVDSGKIYRAGYFDGATNQHILIPNHDDFNSQTFSLMAWVLPEGGSGVNRNYIISKGRQANSPSMSYGLYYDKQINQYGCWVDGLNYNFNESAPLGFAHVACVYDGRYLYFYQNGQQTRTRVDVNRNVRYNMSIDNDLRIGTWWQNTTLRYFQGTIDEVKIYNTNLFQSQIQQIYNNENIGLNYNGTSRDDSCGISAFVDYRFDECEWDGTSGEVKDSGSNGLNATAVNADEDSLEEVQINTGGSFTRSKSQYIHLPTFAPDLPNFNNGFTVTTWAKFEGSAGDYERIFDFGNGPTNHNIVLSRYGTTNTLFFRIWGGPDGNTACVGREMPNVIDANLNFWAVSLDGIRNYKIFKNNVEIASGTTTCMPANVSRNSNFIGRSNWSNNAYFEGKMDEFKIFDTALSTSQIQQVYTNELAKNNYDGTTRNATVCGLSTCFTDDFNRTNLGPKWSIIKADNFTPVIQSGKLVLTDDRNNIAAGVSLIGEFPSNDNLVEIEFEHNAYARTNGADGVTVVLSDGNITPVAGAYGGSLGYAQRSADDGFQGGWLGFGIDEFGNFANDGEGRGTGCSYTAPTSPISGRELDSLTIRGRQGSTLRQGYCFIANSGALDPEIDAVNPQNHKYKFIIDTRSDETKITVQRDIDDGDGYVTLPNMDEVNATQAATAPPTFKLSFTGSTGGSRNWHTFDNLVVRAIGCGTLGQDQNETRNNLFDAWDTSGDIATRDIETKIVRQNFTLNIVSLNEADDDYQDFNGTVCTRLIDVVSDSNVTSWKKLDFTGANLQSETFNSTYATKEAKVEIAWKKDVEEDCPLIVDFNTTRSTDDFAIRPKDFRISHSGDVFAGEDFSLTFQARGGTNSPALSYNEVKNLSFEVDAGAADSNSCINGDFVLDDFNFTNGAASVSGKYSEVGGVNITINEIDGAEFAKVDSGDTSKADRLIPDYTYTLTIKPYDLNITQADYVASTGSDWLYMANKADWADMNASLHVKLEAFNKDGNVTKNFDSLCYAQDVDIDLDFNTTREEGTFSFATSGFNGEEDTNINVTNANLKRTLTLLASGFEKGQAEGSFVFNIDRSFANPISPIQISLNEIKVASTNVAKNENNISNAGKKDFLYGRVRAYDVETSIEKSIETPIFIEYFDDKGAGFSGKGQENSIDWFTNLRHTTEVFDKSGVASTKLDASLPGDGDITGTPVNPSDGVISLRLEYDFTEATKRTMHLDISRWLWHLSGDNAQPYDYSLGSTCKEHPCFEFYYYPHTAVETSDAIHSGGGEKFGGSDFDLSDNNQTQQGVRVFR